MYYNRYSLGTIKEGADASAIAAAILEMNKSRGFRVVGTFADGFTYELFNDVGIDADGNSWIYVGVGAPNKVVAAGTVPSVGEGYEQVTFNSASGVSNANGGSVQDFIDNFDANDINLSIYSDQRANLNSYTAGNVPISGATLRDAFVVSRELTTLTNCHGFADRTLISAATDSGTYGVFDSTVEVGGTHAQDHVYSFQDRVEYSGVGTLSNLSGLYSSPELSGSGNINQRNGVEIRDVNVNGSGSILANIGIFIRDLVAGASNVAINCAQTTGYAMFFGGGAKSYHKGQLGIGVDNNDNAALVVSNSKTAGSDKRMLIDTNSSGGVIAVSGDNTIEVGINARTRYRILNSAGGYYIEPASDLAGGFGSAGKRLEKTYSKNIYVGLGRLITSGSGSPEGVVAAMPGSIYTDENGGAGATLYIKESGNNSYGWVAK